MRTFLREVLLPLAAAVCLAALFSPVYMTDGSCNYLLLWILVGLPFGFSRMSLWLVPHGYGISGTVGVVALDAIIGGLIGGFALIFGLALGVLHTLRGTN